MTTRPTVLPTVFAYLDQHANPAVDMALEHALPHLASPADEAAIDMLVKRMRQPVVVSLIGRFSELDLRLQSLLQNHIRHLSSAIRQVIVSNDVKKRLSAIEFIRCSGDLALTSLLGEAMRVRCGQTQKMAAQSLCEMTSSWLDADVDCGTPSDVVHLSRCKQALCEGLRTGIMRWDLHQRRSVLEAALWMGDALEADIRQLASDVRASVVHAMRDILLTSTDTKMAGFAMQALTIPSLQDAAAQAISQTTDPIFACAILNNAWRLVNPQVQHGFRLVKQSPWLYGETSLLDGLNELQVATSARLVCASGGRSQDKLEQLRRLLGSESEVVREVAIWEVMADQSDQAAHLLETMAGRRRDRVATLALRELHRRHPERGACARPQGDGDSAGHARDSAEAAWHQIVQDQEVGTRSMRECLDSHQASTLMFLRAKCASGQTPNRIKVLQLIHSLDLITAMQEQVYQLSHDPDDYVRSNAVCMLARLPGVISERILRLALNDPDERVVANAIEALDELGFSGRETGTADKLSSPCARIRANAIKSLIRANDAKAASALLEMLEHQSRAHRLSALWVVERSNLRTILTDVFRMAQDDPDERVRRRAQRLLRSWSATKDDKEMMANVVPMFVPGSEGAA